MVLGPSPPDLIVTFETFPVYVYVKLVLVSWILSLMSPVPLKV